MRVVYFPADLDGPGCYRCLYPAAQLIAHGGHECVLGEHTLEEPTDKSAIVTYKLRPSKLDADIVVLQNPGLSQFRFFQAALQSRGIRVVVDVDDNYLALPDYNPASKGFTSDNRHTLTWCLRHADMVTVTTPALRSSLSGVTRAPIAVLRNFLDWKVWGHVPPVYENRVWDKIRVGYMGSSHWHGGDLQVIAPVMRDWLAAHPEVEFVAVGDPNVHEVLGVPVAQRLCVDSFAFRHQGIARYVATMDIGLVPLVRNRFNEAKSHLKGMEYAGVGVPCLATPTESYGDWWLSGAAEGPGGCGFLCDRRAEWVHALDSLVSDPGLIRAMGERARAQAALHTYQSHWRLWEATYLEVLNSPSRAGGDPARSLAGPVGARPAS